MAIHRFSMIFDGLKKELGEDEARRIFPEYSSLPDESRKMSAKEQFELAHSIMERMDHSLEREQIKKIRHSHVCNLTKMQVREFTELKERCESLDELLTACGCIKQGDGAYLLRWDNAKCVCGLCRKLDAYEAISKTWCECCNGHVIKSYSWVCGLPISSEIVETYASGGKSCSFKLSV